jgi:hypothetical protein
MKTAVIHAQQKWEHVAIERKGEAMLVEEMNALGEEGWQLVSVFYFKDPKGTMTWIAFLKRPKTGQAVKAPSAEAGAAAAEATAEKPEAASGEPAGFDLSGDVFEIKKDGAAH